MSKKTLSKNALYSVIYKGLNVLFPLITMAYVSRVLMPIGVGKVASAQNIVAYFLLIASLGLPTYGVKIISSYSDDIKKSSKAFSELFIINAISSIICSFIYIMMLLSVDYFHTRMAISLVVGIQLFANIINIDWLYQGFEEYRYITIRSAIVKVLSLFAVFIFVKEQGDYVIYALITTLGLVSNFVLNIFKLKNFVHVSFEKINIKQHLRPVLVLLASTIAIEIYVLGGTTILNLLRGDEDVAFYTYASKAVSVVRTLIVAVCAVFLPRLNYYYSHHKYDEFNSLASNGIKIILNLCIPTALVLCILSSEIVQILFGLDYLSAIPSMRILCVSLVTIALSNFTGYQILVSIGKQKIVLYSTIIGAIINIAMNFFLIPTYGHFGAAIAAVVTEAVIAMYQFYYVKRNVPLKLCISDIIAILFPSLMMAVLIIMIKVVFDNIYLNILLGCFCGGLIFFIIAYKMKNDFLMMVLKRIPLLSRFFN